MYIYLMLISYLSLSFFNDYFFLKKSKKAIKKINILSIIIIFIIFAFNRETNDTQGYIRRFESPNRYLREDIGYIYLIEAIKFIKGNHFYILFITAVFVTKEYFVKHLNNRYLSLVMLLYSMYALVFDINQLRNSLMVLIVYSLLYTRNNLKFFLGLIISSSFHRVGIIYFIFACIRKIKLKKYIKLIFTSFIFSLIFIKFAKYLFLIFVPDRASFYLQYEDGYGYLQFYFYSFIDLFMIYLTRNSVKDKKSKIELKFILFPFIFLPFSALSMEFYRRIYFNTYIVKFVYLSGKLKKSKKSLFVLILLIMNTLLPLFIAYSMDPKWTCELLKTLNNVFRVN